MDTRTAVWVSTPEKFSKIVLGKTRNFSRKFRGVSAPALDKNPAVNFRHVQSEGFLAAAGLFGTPLHCESPDSTTNSKDSVGQDEPQG